MAKSHAKMLNRIKKKERAEEEWKAQKEKEELKIRIRKEFEENLRMEESYRRFRNANKDYPYVRKRCYRCGTLMDLSAFYPTMVYCSDECCWNN